MELIFREPFRLVYSSGNEHNPTDRAGRVTLEIRGDGSVTVENVKGGGAYARTFVGATTREVVERILGHLRHAGFPIVPDHPIPAGAALRVLAIEAGGESVHGAPTSWDASDGMPGYREAYRILDSIITAVSEGALKMLVSPEPDVASARPR